MNPKKSLPMALALAALTFAACGGGTEGGTAGAGEDIFARDILPLLASTCATGGCHESGAGGITINVSSPDTAYANVQSLLVKGNSAASDLITVLDRGMPPDGRATATYASDVAAWIDAGAIRYEGEEPTEDLPTIDWQLHVDADSDGTVDGDVDLDGTNDEHLHMLEGATFVDEDQLAESGKYYIPPESIQITFVNPTTRVAVTDPRGASPVVTFQIVDPTNGNAPYTDILDLTNNNWPDAWHTGWDKQWVMKAGSAAAYQTDPRRTANIEILVGWDNDDFVMNWSGAEIASASLSKARGQPITATLSNYYTTNNSTGKVTSVRTGLWTYNAASASYTVNFSYLAGTTPRAVGAEATGSGTVSIGGKQYWLDGTTTPFTYTASGTTYTYLNPTTSDPVEVPTTYQSQLVSGLAVFPINPADVEAIARREVVDNERCNRCHTMLAFHGSNRNGKALTCTICHNPNATNSLAPLAPIDFKYMIHAIHAGSEGVVEGGMRETDYGFGNSRTPSSPYDFSEVWFPAQRNKCEICHLPGTWALPYLGTGVGTTIDPGANANDPADNLRISPTAALCSACHDSTLVRAHMENNGGTFNAVQDLSADKLTKSYYYVNGTSVQRLETCVLCHEKNVLRTQHNF